MISSAGRCEKRGLLDGERTGCSDSFAGPCQLG